MSIVASRMGAKPKGSNWNLFSLYLHVITRINFMVDYVPHSLAQRDFHLRSQYSCSHIEEFANIEKLLDNQDAAAASSSQPPPPPPPPPASSQEAWYCPSCSKNLVIPPLALANEGSRRATRIWSNYLAGKGLTESFVNYPTNRRVGLHYLEERRSSGFLSTISEKFEPKRWSLLINSLEYTYVQLVLFFSLVSTATFLVVKLTLHSTVWAEKGILEEPYAEDDTATATTSTTFQPLGATFQQAKGGLCHLLRHLLHYYFLNDMFVKFSNSRLFNLIAMFLLFPSAIVRLRQLLRLFGKIIFGSDHTHHHHYHDYHETRHNSPTINTVQLNLSYLHSLRTSTNLWWRLVNRSWFHRHHLQDLDKELEDVLRTGASGYSGPGLAAIQDSRTLIELDLKTMLYFYNMIHFDRCYVNYFTTNGSQNSRVHDEGDQTVTVGRAKKDIFVAKPIHRIDLYHMAWLLIMLLVLYILGSLSILVPTLCSAAIEMNIENFDQLTLENLASGWLLLKTELTWPRLIQIFFWQNLIILAIFDLFNFYSCCIICFSRAAHLRRHLEQISHNCWLLNEISQVKGTTSTVTAGPSLFCNMDEDPVGHYSSLLVVSDTIVTPLRIKSTNHTITTSSSSATSSAPSSASSQQQQQQQQEDELGLHWKQIKSINNQLECVINWVLLIQQELIDLKKFFANYLILEIIFKVLCLIHVLSAFISNKGQLFENTFLVVNGNTAFTPIVIVVVMASLIESQFKGICYQMERIMVRGRKFLTLRNRRQLVIQANYLSIKNNRSFVLAGHFALTLGSLMPVVGWIASGIVLLRRSQEQDQQQ